MIQMLIGMMGASEVKPFSREQQFITPGTYEFVVPRGVKQIKALVIGGGGGASTNMAAESFPGLSPSQVVMCLQL